VDPAALRAELRQKKFRPAYLFSGDQDLLKDECLEELRRAVAGERGAVRKLYASEVGAVEVLEMQGNLSLLEPVAAVVVRQAARFGEAEGEILLRGLERVTGGPPIVLSDVSFDKRRTLFAAIAKQGAEVEFQAPRRRELRAWIEGEAGRRGHRLGPGVAELLAELVGGDLLTLRSTIDVLSLAVGEGKPIDEAAVTRMVPAARVHAFWELQDALLGRDAGKALAVYRKMLEEGETPYVMLGALAAELRRLLLAREMDPRTAAAHAAPVLGVAPFKAERLLTQAQRFPVRHLRRALERLRGIDLALKTGRGRPVADLEEWLLFLCAPEAGAPATPQRS
jgi:DNA polymerase-3 subunit delta